MQAKRKKTILLAVLIPLAAVILAALCYVLYVVLSYYRVQDNLSPDVQDGTSEAAPIGEELTLLTYNIGFGAYSADYSFFMDGGEHARAYSRQAVLDNTAGAIQTMQEVSADFVLVQEVDVDGTRSYHVDQSALLADALAGYDRIYAQNYDSPYFLYPFHSPIGANRSGIMTFSRFNITAALRRSLPIEDTLYKFLDLDRAYTVSRVQTANGRELVLYNVHLSAYTSDGKIADEQLKLLGEDMAAEIAVGNYVIAAGDFNKDLLGDSSQYFERAEGAYTWAKPLNMAMLPDGIEVYTGSNLPTCRNADAPYRGDGTDFVLSVDGVLVGGGVKVISCETVGTGFAYSDHDPVQMRFVLTK